MTFDLTNNVIANSHATASKRKTAAATIVKASHAAIATARAWKAGAFTIPGQCRLKTA